MTNGHSSWINVIWSSTKFALKRILWSFIVFGALLCIDTAQAEELVVALSNIPPWSIAKEGTCEGINIEILEIFSRKLGIKFRYVVCPWKRCLAMMESGEADLMGTLLKSPDREIYMHYIDPPYWEKSRKIFFLQKGKTHLLKKHADLHNLTIGVLRGAKYFAAFDNDPKIVKYEVAKPIQLLRMLEKGRIDAFIGAQLPMEYRLLNYPEFKGKFEKAIYMHETKSSVYMAISKKSPFADRMPRFNKVMKQLVMGGEVVNIIDDFFQ